MGKVKGKRGKNARRSRQGQLGLARSSLSEKSGPFRKRAERREERKDAQKEMEQLREELLLPSELAATGAAKAGGKKKAKLERVNEKRDMPNRVPHTFVLHSTGGGARKVGRYARRLEHDLRRMLEPHTSAHLRVLKRNNLRDFIVGSQQMGVSHLLVLSRSGGEKLAPALNLRLIRNPQGPTLSFRVLAYSLSRDILANQRRPLYHEELFHTAPLLVMTGFTAAAAAAAEVKEDSEEKKPTATPTKAGEVPKHVRLIQAMLQTMFPTIDVDTVKLTGVKRVVLISYDPARETLDLRHYALRLAPTGLSRPISKLMQPSRHRAVPDLSRYGDFTDFVLNPEVLSESEGEGEEKVEMELPQDVHCRGQTKGQMTKIRLFEIGPRLSLQLIKIEEEVNDGEVLYHRHVHKKAAEVEALRRRAPISRRRREQHERQVEFSTIRKLRQRFEEVKQAEKEKRREKLERKMGRKEGNEDDGAGAEAEEEDEEMDE